MLGPLVASSLTLLVSSAWAQAASPNCPTTPIKSCSSDAQTADSCCVASPGGIVVFTQRFEPDVGDEGQWGIDGVEVWDCEYNVLPPLPPTSPRAYSPEQISSFTHRSLASTATQLAQLEREWAESEVGEGMEEIWSRAWSKGGRLISTLARRCFGEGYNEGDEVTPFFEALHKLHRSIQPYDYLQRADITPSEDMSYSLSEITSALTTGGLSPFLTCENNTLSSVSWPLHVVGTYQQADFEAVEGDFAKHGNCPFDGIRYPPAEARPLPTTSHTWDPVYRPSPRALRSQGDDATAGMFEPGDKRVVDTKLGFFKRSDDGRDANKESGKGKGRAGVGPAIARDEL